MTLEQTREGVEHPRRKTSMSKLSPSERAQLEVKIALESARLDKIKETERNRPNVLTGEGMTATLLLNGLISHARKSRSKFRRTMDHGLQIKALDLTLVKPRGLSKEVLVNKMREDALSYIESIRDFKRKNPKKLEDMTGHTSVTFEGRLNHRSKEVNALADGALNMKSPQGRLDAAMRLEAACNYTQLLLYRAEHADSLRYQEMLDDEKLQDVCTALEDCSLFNYKAFEALADASFEENAKIRHFFEFDQQRKSDFPKEFGEYEDAEDSLIAIGNNLRKFENLYTEYLQVNMPIFTRACNKLFDLRRSLEAKISPSEASSSKPQKSAEPEPVDSDFIGAVEDEIDQHNRPNWWE